MTETGLNNEQSLLTLLSRITFKEGDKENITSLVRGGIDWYSLFAYAIINKVSLLAWHNLRCLNHVDAIPKHLEKVIWFYYLGNCQRNEVYLKERDAVLMAFRANGIDCAPLKGALLIKDLYREIGVRQINDIDCMVKKADTNRITEVMRSMGYQQADYDESTQTLEEPPRKKSLLWKLNMNTTYPFRKIGNSVYAPVIEFDFSFSLDLNLRTGTVDAMMSRTQLDEDGLLRLRPADFFLHLCCHLYKEATNAVWVTLGRDINLIKFCDVREYILRCMPKGSLQEAVGMAQDEGLQEAVYYTLHYLQQIYADGYEADLLHALSVEDAAFLDQFGKRDYEDVLTWKKSFWERLFSLSNVDELPDKPRVVSVESKEEQSL